MPFVRRWCVVRFEDTEIGGIMKQLSLKPFRIVLKKVMTCEYFTQALNPKDARKRALAGELDKEGEKKTTDWKLSKVEQVEGGS